MQFYVSWSDFVCLSIDFDLRLSFGVKMTPKTRFGVKMTPKPPFLGGKTPLGGVPPKKRQKRTDFEWSQSSYRAKSQRSSPTKPKSSKCNFSSRILKEKMQFFRRLSLGKVAHGNFKGKPIQSSFLTGQNGQNDPFFTVNTHKIPPKRGHF